MMCIIKHAFHRLNRWSFKLLRSNEVNKVKWGKKSSIFVTYEILNFETSIFVILETPFYLFKIKSS